MRLMTTTRLASAALAIALCLPAAAWAQTSTATPPAAAAPAAGTTRQKVEQRIADMYATLRITQAQERQWNDFAQVMLDNAQAMDALAQKNAADTSTQDAEQILQSYAAITQQHAQNVQRLLPAFRTLYASLSPEQRKQADDMFRERAEQREQKQGAQMQTEQKPGG